MSMDPTTAAIERAIDVREKLCAEVLRLERALAAAYTDVQVLTAERDRLRTVAEMAEATKTELFRLRTIADEADRAFEKGYDQAVREIHDHFRKQKDTEVSGVINKIWLKERS